VPFFKLSYTGKKRWNYTTTRIVLAKDEKQAINHCAVPAEWTVEEVKDEPGECAEIILGDWIGDPY
jgi:hypothetical protein